MLDRPVWLLKIHTNGMIQSVLNLSAALANVAGSDEKVTRSAFAPPIVAWVAMGAVCLFLAYWLIFVVTTDDGLARGAVLALNNAVPAIALAWLAHLVLDRYVWPAPFWVRLAAQLPLSILFALAWYLAIVVVRELREGWLTQGFLIRPFAAVPLAWQMLQGVTFYALSALASIAIVLVRRVQALEAAANAAADQQPRTAHSTILVRTAEGAEAVSVDDIVTISGAGDYSELALRNRIVLSTTSLAEFEARLPQERFFRAHRSHLVRLGAVARSEPAGNGRTVLHLVDGRAVITSRAGTRALREASL